MVKLQNNNKLKQKGSAMVEYSIILAVMSLIIYLAVVRETSSTVMVNNTSPALTRSLADHEKNFINTLSMP